MSTSPGLPPGADAELHRRWRLRLAVVAAVLGLGAAMATALALGYDEPLRVPLLLWLGTACLALAWRTVPRTVTAGERPAMATSGAWVVLGVVLYVVVPVLLSR